MNAIVFPQWCKYMQGILKSWYCLKYPLFFVVHKDRLSIWNLFSYVGGGWEFHVTYLKIVVVLQNIVKECKPAVTILKV